ncbi:hypothetical protein B0O80DRAFT_127114 [Mortierella sp. GBAus27b]|nr:hypothetical protein B0O80DRAFT_127114 [Mortierella sp. GBAus27b]
MTNLRRARSHLFSSTTPPSFTHTVSMKGEPSQAFRADRSSKVITIPTRQDPKSGQLVIRWKDILSYFENAKIIMKAEDVVLFLTDDNLEDLIPLRIAHHPGVVLEVITQDGNQGVSSSMGNGISGNDGRADTFETTDDSHNQTRAECSCGPLLEPLAQEGSSKSSSELNCEHQLRQRARQIQGQDAQQKIQEVDTNIRRLDTSNKRQYTVGTKFIAIIFCLSFVTTICSSWHQYRQHLISEVETAQQLTRQLVEQIDLVQKEMREIDQRTRMSQQRLQENIDKVLRLAQQSFQITSGYSCQQQLQYQAQDGQQQEKDYQRLVPIDGNVPQSGQVNFDLQLQSQQQIKEEQQNEPLLEVPQQAQWASPQTREDPGSFGLIGFLLLLPVAYYWIILVYACTLQAPKK